MQKRYFQQYRSIISEDNCRNPRSLQSLAKQATIELFEAVTYSISFGENRLTSIQVPIFVCENVEHFGYVISPLTRDQQRAFCAYLRKYMPAFKASLRYKLPSLPQGSYPENNCSRESLTNIETQARTQLYYKSVQFSQSIFEGKNLFDIEKLPYRAPLISRPILNRTDFSNWCDNYLNLVNEFEQKFLVTLKTKVVISKAHEFDTRATH